VGGFCDLFKQKLSPLFHIIGLELNLICLPDDAVLVSGCDGEGCGVTKVGRMSQVDTILHPADLLG
jgi:hypothetical protein